jgi:catechol 2,3-dioxygenase-like lactoylglutathione lyase family enzyme
VIDADFDHLALAAPDRSELNRRYAGDLGARFVTNGATAGLYATIVRFSNGVRLEAIEPYGVEQDDFLVRFLARHGPGFHHITFVVPSVDAAAAESEARGYRILGSRTEHLTEVFLHPKEALGVVVQYVEPRDYSGATEPPGFPTGSTCANLDHVSLVVGSLDEARRLFVDLLSGQDTALEHAEAARWVDVSWRTPGTLRLLEPAAASPLSTWLGDRSGAVHHLAFTVDDPDAVPDAEPVGEGLWTVAPDRNLGVRLHLRLSRIAAPNS